MVAYRFCSPKTPVRICALASIVSLLSLNVGAIEIYDLLSDNPSDLVPAGLVSQPYDDLESQPPEIPDLVIPGETISTPSSEAEPYTPWVYNVWDSTPSTAYYAPDMTLRYFFDAYGYVAPGVTEPHPSTLTKSVYPGRTSAVSKSNVYGVYQNITYTVDGTSFNPEDTNFVFDGIRVPDMTYTVAWDLEGINFPEGLTSISCNLHGYGGVLSNAISSSTQIIRADSVTLWVNERVFASGSDHIRLDDNLWNFDEPIHSIRYVVHLPSWSPVSLLKGYSSSQLKSWAGNSHTFAYYLGTGHANFQGAGTPWLNIKVNNPVAFAELNQENIDAKTQLDQLDQLEQPILEDFESSSDSVLTAPSLGSGTITAIGVFKDYLTSLYSEILPSGFRGVISIMLVLGFIMWLLKGVRDRS